MIKSPPKRMIRKDSRLLTKSISRDSSMPLWLSMKTILRSLNLKLMVTRLSLNLSNSRKKRRTGSKSMRSKDNLIRTDNTRLTFKTVESISEMPREKVREKRSRFQALLVPSKSLNLLQSLETKSSKTLTLRKLLSRR